MATSPCSQCDAPDAGFRCGGFLVELYCRGACQKAHWRAHKPACLAGQALRAELVAAFLALGFQAVSLDLEGLVSGKLNRALS